MSEKLNEKIKKSLEELVGYEFSSADKHDIYKLVDKIYDVLWDGLKRVCPDFEVKYLAIEDPWAADLIETSQIIMMDIICPKKGKRYVAMMGLNYVIADVEVEEEDI